MIHPKEGAHMVMPKKLWVVAVVISALALAAVCCADTEFTLYGGTLDKVTLAPWGAGKVKQDKSEKLFEKSSLRVDTTGFHEGGSLLLKSPLDLGPFLENKAGSFLVLMVKPHEPTPVTQGVTGAGGMPGMPGMPGMGMPGMGMPGMGMPGMGM